MFQLKGKMLVVDQSQFKLGAKIVVYEEGKVLLHTTVENLDLLADNVIKIADGMDIQAVFIKPLAVENKEKVLSKYKKAISKFSNEKLDKIHFHMI